MMTSWSHHHTGSTGVSLGEYVGCGIGLGLGISVQSFASQSHAALLQG